MRRRCSATVRYSNKCGSSGMNARARLAAIASATMSWPSMVMRPEVGLRMPAIDRKVVVLPAPLGPISPTISPAASVKDRPSTAVKAGPEAPA